MSKNTTLLLVLWNALLSAGLGWSLMRQPAVTTSATSDPAPQEPLIAPMVNRDTSGLKDARIAFFLMDSVQAKYELIAEKDKRFRSEGQRLENSLKNEMSKAQARYDELMRKDHTYSTQAEMAKDEQELQQLMARIQSQQASSEEQLAKLEAEMLTEITKELRAYLEVYNRTAGYDYIFSVQNGGQIWVGNKGLDISDDLINGLNQRHRSGKATTK